MEIKLTKQELKEIMEFNNLEQLKMFIRCSSVITDNKDIASNTSILADVAQPGDFVNYDAGIWNRTKEEPIIRRNFGGYMFGTNKGTSLEGCKHGWRIIRIDNGKVTLVHAGIPEYCYYGYEYSNEGVDDLNRRAMEQYLNKDYAESVHMLTKEEIDVFTCENDLRFLGAPYYVATAYGTDRLWFVGSSGSIYATCDDSFGIRPAVELYPYIQTTGQSEDIFGNKAWQLVKKI